MANIGGKGEQNVSRVMGSTKEVIKPFFFLVSALLFSVFHGGCVDLVSCVLKKYSKRLQHILFFRGSDCKSQAFFVILPTISAIGTGHVFCIDPLRKVKRNVA